MRLLSLYSDDGVLIQMLSEHEHDGRGVHSCLWLGGMV